MSTGTTNQKKTTAKKATKGKTASTKAKRGTTAKKKQSAKKQAEPTPSINGLTSRQVRVLEVLKSGREMTRKEMAEATGITKGWSKMLGAASKQGGGAAAGKGLEQQGYVKIAPNEEGRTLLYSITAKGRKLLAKAE